MPLRTYHRQTISRIRLLTNIIAVGVSLLGFLAADACFGQTYLAHLSGGSEVPSTLSTGSGTISAALHGDTLTVSGVFSGLRSDFNTDAAGGSHIHIGYPGRNGPIAMNLSVEVNPDNRGGVFQSSDNRFVLTDDQTEALTDRRLYVNVHSKDYPGGELRGQLLPLSDAVFEVTLSGGAAVPVAATTASGAIVAELNGDILRLTGSFGGLTGAALLSEEPGPIHLHLSYAGGVGSAVFPLHFKLDPGYRSGVLTANGNVYRLTPGQIDVLMGRGFYIDIHTTTFPSGELRGQVLPMADLYFQGEFKGLNEVPPNTSGGTGGVVAELRGDQLVVTGTFAQMIGPFDADVAGGAHLHLGGPAESGPIVIPLAAKLADPKIGHFFAASSNTIAVTPEQIEYLVSGRLYANVHTEAFPGGELRAQLLRSPNNPPLGSDILEPAPGPAIKSGGPANDEFDVRWSAVDDPEDDEVVYVWQLSRDPDFGRDKRLADLKAAEPMVRLTQGELDSLLALANLPVDRTRTFYHRVISSDGSGWTSGVMAPLRVTRGALTEQGALGGQELPASREEGPPAMFTLRGAYPNPFNPRTHIVFDLEHDADVSVDVFDVTGRPVMSVDGGMVEAGNEQSVQVDASSLPSGVYLYRVKAVFGPEEASARIESGRIVLLK